MHVNLKTNTTLLLTGFAIAFLVTSTGCRTGGFAKPDIGKLAFWKSENSLFASKANKMPPPPARHFDPSPLGGESDTRSEIADNGDLKMKYKNDITEMRAEIDAAAKSLSKPIREPYSSGADEAISEFANNANSQFDAQAGKVRSKLSELDGNVNSKLSLAQNDFQAAMNNTSNSFSNDFAGSTKPKNDPNSGWKDEFSLPAGLTSMKNGIDNSLAGTNNSLKDAHEKIESRADQAVNQFNQQVKSYQDTLANQMNTAKSSANEFKANIQSNMAQAGRPKNSFSPNAQPFDPSPETGFGGSTNMMQPVQKSQPEIESVQTQMAEAKRQIEELKKQVAMANQNTPPAFGSSPQTMQQGLAPVDTAASANKGFAPNGFAPMKMPVNSNPPSERVAQLDAPGLGGQFGSQAGTTRLNPLRSNDSTTLQNPQPGNSQPFTPGNSISPYPATSHGGFAPRGNDLGGNFAPQQSGSQVGFQSNGNQSMVATANNTLTPSIGAARIENHVSEVDIPAAILTGSGSYAPGSIQPLQSGR